MSAFLNAAPDAALREVHKKRSVQQLKIQTKTNMQKTKFTKLTALFLGISLLSNIGFANAASPAQTKTKSTMRSIPNTPGGSQWIRNETIGSNSSAYSINGTTRINPKTGKVLRTGNVSPTMDGKPTGFWKGQDGNSYFNPKNSYVYYDRNDGIAKVALGETVIPKHTVPSSKPAIVNKTVPTKPVIPNKTVPSHKSSSSSKLYTALGIKTGGGSSNASAAPYGSHLNPYKY